MILLLLSLLWLATNTPVLAQGPNIEENEKCLTCHSNPDLLIEFTEGSTASGYVSGLTYNASVHGRQEMTCGGCHPGHEAYPHPELAVADSRAFTMELNKTCFECHPDQAELVQDSTHARALAAGHPEAAVCVDCHGAHDTVSLHVARVKIATTCRQCHSTIYDDYSQSAHGTALREEHNTDVPTCVDCHGVHNLENPHTVHFRLTSPDLCGGCHANEALMSKYDISTDVFETYVADFHGSTVTLFEKQSPDAVTNKAVCYDCHGIHAIRSMDDPAAIASKKENLLRSCQKCHPDATLNFPDSWASHFPATFDKQPLVTAVNLFYALLIPGLIGFMGLFVVTDAGRKMLNRGKKEPPPPAIQAPDTEMATEAQKPTKTEPSESSPTTNKSSHKPEESK